MIIVTGGAGFIGSNIVKALNRIGRDDILVVDRLGTGDKWKNLVGLNFDDYRHAAEFIDQWDRGLFDKQVEAIFHMGACSATTERDADYLMANNYQFSCRLAAKLSDRDDLRFIYASSAATYGDGSEGYSDDHECVGRLRPLNMYGYSKQLFDLWMLRTGLIRKAVGLKYFNVFGPNEYHKADMRSVVIRAYYQAKTTGKIRLFKSYRPQIKDGEQKRDFIYIDDAVKITLFFLDKPQINGLFNAGTGTPHTFNQLAGAIVRALHGGINIEYIDMPEGLEPKYQYYTAADTVKLQAAGFEHCFMPIEDSVADYVTNYLEKDPERAR